MDYYRIVSELTGINYAQLQDADSSGGLRSLLADFDPKACDSVQYKRLDMLRNLVIQCLTEEFDQEQFLQDDMDVVQYCAGLFSGFEDQEMLYAVYLDQAGLVLSVELVSAGAQTVTIVPHGVILRRALLCNATQIVLCHNHLCHDSIVSEQDILVTKEFEKLCLALGIGLRDHVIVSVTGKVSMRKIGILS